MRNGSGPVPVLIRPLMMKGTTIIGKGQELHQVKPFLMKKSKHKSQPRKGLGHDAMNEALDRISKSPFTRKIEGAKLPWQFHQPTFTMYNGLTDPIEHVS